MLNIQGREVPISTVMALFTDSVGSFSLTDGAKFGDLADKFARLVGWCPGVPMSVALTVGLVDRSPAALTANV